MKPIVDNFKGSIPRVLYQVWGNYRVMYLMLPVSPTLNYDISSVRLPNC